jgi:hypothetical protein
MFTTMREPIFVYGAQKRFEGYKMTVKELILELQKRNGDARVFAGYDGNIVVTEPFSVISPVEEEIRDCWWSVKSGDVVILCDG